MYQLIVTHGTHTYSLFGDSLNIEDYPTIPVGAFVSVPATGDIYYIHSPKKGFDLDNPEGVSEPDIPDEEPGIPDEEPDNSTSTLGEAIIGEMNIGE